MQIPSNYSINVAKAGLTRCDRWNPKGMAHYCKIELGEPLPEQAMKKFREIKKLFPEDEFELKLYHITCYGEEIKE